jgi:hypothetical protein
MSEESETQSEESETQGVSELNQTVLKIIDARETIIVIAYDLLPDTSPGENGHFAAIWQNKNRIPYAQPPEATVAIEGLTQKGQFSFPVELNQNAYIIGYSVGPVLEVPSQKYGNVCSTAYVPRGLPPSSLMEGDVVKAERDETFLSDLRLGVSTGDVVSFKYAVPENCEPKTNKAWIGVFRGSASYTKLPEKAVPMTSNEDSGWMSIKHKFVANKRYTLAYFMSGYSDAPIQKRMATTLSFTA